MNEVKGTPSAALPWHVAFAFFLVAVLRSLPFIATRLSHDPRVAYLPIGYIPKDFLQYIALIRQAGAAGPLTLENPFTTQPQSGRIILLFHTLLGQLAAWTHIDPFWMFELSRIPLLAVLAWVLWRFLTPILPDTGHRAWACWLVAFSGGLEFLVRPLGAHLPPIIAPRTGQDLWHLFGWNSFESFYNPLWIAALILLLVVLRPLLQPGGPRSWKDGTQAALGLIALYFTHPYTGVAVVPIVAVYLVLRLIFRDGAVLHDGLRIALALLPAALIIAPISAWQNQDDVFKLSSRNAFGSQEIAVFWYPIGLGALCVFVLLGWRRFIAEAHPWRFALGGWMIAVALLHSSPLINGYKFLWMLHVPVCIVAAPAVADAFAALWPLRKPLALAMLAVLFAANLELSYRCLDEVQGIYPNGSLINPDYLAAAQAIAAAPDGPVLAAPALGNIIPAYGPQHVYVGHWFMTPNFIEKSREYDQLVAYLESSDVTPQLDSSVRQFVSEHKFRYVVIPTRAAARAQAILGPTIVRTVDARSLTILELQFEAEPH